MKKKLIAIIFVLSQLLLPVRLMAQPIESGAIQGMQQQTVAARQAAGFANLGENGLNVIAEKIIKAFLGLLGLIFIILMILAGYNWMTAGGDEQKVSKSKDTIRHAVIGLIVIMAAYLITYFVFTLIPFGSGT